MGKKTKEAKEKPLEKMTATELREIAMEISEITGAHGMNKPELIAAVKKARGIEDDKPRRSSRSVRDLKKKIRVLRSLKEESIDRNDKKMAAIYRRRISRLKKKSRRAAA